VLYRCLTCWSDLTIHKLFATRADLHRTVYTHAKVKVSGFTKVSIAKTNYICVQRENTNICCCFLCQAIELMVLDALVKADPYLQIASSIDQPSEFWKVLSILQTFDVGDIFICQFGSDTLTFQLDDSILKIIETSSQQELKESRDLILRIHRRDLYQVRSTW
jgi:hypothetical protein